MELTVVGIHILDAMPGQELEFQLRDAEVLVANVHFEGCSRWRGVCDECDDWVRAPPARPSDDMNESSRARYASREQRLRHCAGLHSVSTARSSAIGGSYWQETTNIGGLARRTQPHPYGTNLQHSALARASGGSGSLR
eukprot:COSAG04_NODE_1795_length_5563_cov_9.186493_4_plen_139_part_00